MFQRSYSLERDPSMNMTTNSTINNNKKLPWYSKKKTQSVNSIFIYEGVLAYNKHIMISHSKAWVTSKLMHRAFLLLSTPMVNCCCISVFIGLLSQKSQLAKPSPCVERKNSGEKIYIYLNSHKSLVISTRLQSPQGQITHLIYVYVPQNIEGSTLSILGTQEIFLSKDPFRAEALI